MSLQANLQGLHSSEYENNSLLGCDVVWSGRKLQIFIRNILIPSSV
jgi:hypothetical protein